MNIDLHGVTSITLKAEYLGNGNSRTIQIKTETGETLSIVLWGNTDAAALLPKDEDYVDMDHFVINKFKED